MSSSIRLKVPEFRASSTALQSLLQGKLAQAKAELVQAARRTAAEAAEALADRTFPKGYGFVLAKGHLTHELKMLYVTVGPVFESMVQAGEQSLAVRFYAAYKSQDYAEARRLLATSRTPWRSVPIAPLDPTLHDRFRNPVSGHIEVERPQQIVTLEELKSYTALAIRRLGKTASGWSACAEQLGGDGNKPKWKGTAVHGSDGGHVQISETETGTVIVMQNTRPLARKHLSPGQIRTIMRKARRDMTDRLIKGSVLRRGKRAA